MAEYSFKVPGGGVLRITAPDDATEDQVLEYANAQFERMIGKPSNPTDDLSGPERFAAGAGKATMDTARGIGQLVGAVDQSAIDEAAASDAPLMDTRGGFWGNVTGHAAQMAIPGAAATKAGLLTRAPTLLPSLAAKSAGRLIPAAAGAGAYAGLQPVESGDSRIQNAGIGALAGAAGQVGGEGLAKIAQGGANMLTPAVKALAQKAEAFGIPLSTAQLTDSKTIKLLQSVLDRLPFSGAGKRQQGQQAAFNRAVAAQMGAQADNLGPDVMAGAKQRIGDTFTRLSQRNAAAVDNQLLNDLADVTSAARRNAVPDNAQIVDNLADDILSMTNNGKIAGTAYREMDTHLGRLAKQASDGDRRHYIGQLREALRSAMDRSVSPMTKKEWDQARKQWRAMKTVAEIQDVIATGNVSPAALLAKVTKGDRNAAFKGSDELLDLARIGKTFLRDSIPDSGTAQRMFIQQALMNMGGLGAGSTGVALGMDPYSVFGALAFGRYGGKALNSRLARAYAQHGLGPFRSAVEGTGRALPYGAAGMVQARE